MEFAGRRGGWLRLLPPLAIAGGVALWGGSRHPIPPSQRAEISADYAEAGEYLIHSMIPPAQSLARMPGATFLHALLVFHSSESASRFLEAAIIPGAVAMLIGMGYLLGAPWQALLASAVWLAPKDSSSPFQFGFTTTAFTLWVLLCACAQVWRAREPGWPSTLALACALASSITYRSTLVFLGPLAAVCAVSGRRPNGGRPWLQALVLAAGPIAVLLPGLWLKAHIQGAGGPLESGATTNLVLGAMGAVTSGPVAWDVLVGAGKSPFAWALAETLAHPGRFFLGVMGRLLFLFKLHPLILAAGAVSLWRGRERPEIRHLGLFAAYFAGMYCLMPVQERYFEPLWPVVTLLGAAGLTWPAAPGRWLQACRSAGLGIFKAGLAVLAAIPLLACGLTAVLAARMALGRALPLDQGLSRALADHPGDPWLRFHNGRLRLARGELEGAAADLAEVHRALPGWTDAVSLLGFAQGLREGDPRFLQILPFAHPNDKEVLRNIFIAALHIRRGTEADARRVLQGAMMLSCRPELVLRTEGGEVGRLTAAAGEGCESGFARTIAETDVIPVPLRLALLSRLEAAPAARNAALIGRASLALESGRPADARKALMGVAAPAGLRINEVRSLEALYRGLQDPGRHASVLRELARRSPASPGPSPGSPGPAPAVPPSAPTGERLMDEARRALDQASGAGGELGASKALLAGAETAARAEPPGRKRDQLRRLARLRREAGEVGKSLDLFRELAEENPRDPGGWKDLAQEALSAGRSDEALRALQRLETLGASNRENRLNLAGLLTGRGRPEEAIPLLEELAGKTPADTQTSLALAEAALQAKKPELARAALDRAERSAREFEDLRRAAHLRQRSGDHKRELELLQGLATREPARADLLLDRALAEHRNGLAPEAEASLLAAIRLNPGLLEATISLGAIYEGQGRGVEALALYDRALSRPSGIPEPGIRELLRKTRDEARRKAGGP